ncbi:ArsR/SmtB family transcription factor [Streptomyces sp. KLOTTS4A1]|uniref:ArsR/SmtB family transcription factor n=1 Tax=Streptomyces sp. KLOTTS4A1 TaxID=3390996 RepID=UPI0039F624BC
MAESNDARSRVLDPQQDTAALKALVHPLRIELLGLLRQDGPATATELAARTGESSASTSYHLRVLAKHGFVAEAEHRDGRERRWRSVHETTSWSNEALHASPGTRHLLSTLRERQIEHLRQSLARHEADLAEGRLGPEWVEPSGISDTLPRLTPQSLTELSQAFQDKIAELAARDAQAPDAEQVVVVVAGLAVAAHEQAAAGEHAAPQGERTTAGEQATADESGSDRDSEGDHS